MKIDTRVVSTTFELEYAFVMFDQITIDSKEAWSAPVDFSFKFVKQSAIQVFDNIVGKQNMATLACMGDYSAVATQR